MTIEYIIDESDFLTYQLFIASKSDRIKKKRLKSKIVVPLIYIGFGLFVLSDDIPTLAVIFFLFAILWYFIYPLWEKRRYINHYKGFIKENFKDRFGKPATLELSKDFILTKDVSSESKILTTEIEEICEIPTTIFVRLKGGQSFLLPKGKIADIDNVKANLKELAAYLNIEYNVDEKWKWS